MKETNEMFDWKSFDDGCKIRYTRYNLGTEGWSNIKENCPDMPSHIKEYCDTALKGPKK